MSAVARRRQPGRRRPSRCRRRRTAAVSPATPSSAASSRSSTAVRMVWTATGARAPTVTWRRTSSSSRRPSVEARFRLLQLRRRWDPNADDPLFRPIDADDFRTNGENASDFSNLRQNGLIRIVFPLPPNIRLIDPATNLPSSETFVDVWRAVPTVNDVALTGPDGVEPVAARPEQHRRISAGCARGDAAGAGARRADQSRADPERRRRNSSSTTWPRFSACSSRTIAFARSPTRSRDGHDTVAGSGSAAQRARAAGQGRLRARLRPVPRRPRAVDAKLPVVRFHDIASAVSASRRHRHARPLRLCAVPGPARAECADLRDHAVAPCRARRRSGVRAPIRAARRLLTGISSGRAFRFAGPGRRLEQVRRARASRDQQDGSVLPQQQRRARSKRWSITTSSSSSA